ncbi:MAG: HAD-IIIA family hydrolase [Deltaproteobacteria bacterium]|nr:HAD-IIIA family hydrolase [Candidatus Zymogenaceae bacterium]
MHLIDPNAHEKAERIKLIIFDVDGVLTDGSIIIHADRSESKEFNVKDGHGIKLAMRAGIQAAVITGRKSDVVGYRVEELGIEHLFQGKLEKSGVVTELLDRLSLAPEDAAFVGDDLIDIPAMRMVGLAAAVADAVDEAKQYAHIITDLPGGRGAAREVCEFILKSQKLWESSIERYVK